MKLGIISDTHNRLPKEVFTIFDGVDRILHAGDINRKSIITDLSALAPVSAVRGNCDGFPLASELDVQLILELQSVKVMLIHVFSPPHRLDHDYKQGLNEHGIGVVIFGHTHMACNVKDHEILFFNPGSASDPVSGRNSVGIIEINRFGGSPQVSGKIIEI
jgi:putative phosphoesterase